MKNAEETPWCLMLLVFSEEFLVFSEKAFDGN